MKPARHWVKERKKIRKLKFMARWFFAEIKKKSGSKALMVAGDFYLFDCISDNVSNYLYVIYNKFSNVFAWNTIFNLVRTLLGRVELCTVLNKHFTTIFCQRCIFFLNFRFFKIFFIYKEFRLKYRDGLK